jgi:hypothetical protein
MKLPKFLAVASILASLCSVAHSADALTTQQKYDALAAKGIFTGINGEAALEQNMNRAQFARVAALTLGLEGMGETDTKMVTENPFANVELGLWYTEEIAAAKEAGVFVGNADGTFSPKGDITVQELAVIAAKLLGLEPRGDANVTGAADWAAGYIQAIIDSGIIFPTNYTERAQRSDLANLAFIADTVINPQQPKTSVVAALKNTITYRGPDGKVTTIEIGTGAIVDENGNVINTMSLKDLIALEAQNGTSSNPNSLTAGLMNVVDQLSTRVGAGEYGTEGANILASVIGTLSAANPAAAADYGNAAIKNIASSPTMSQADKKAAAVLVLNSATAAADSPAARNVVASKIYSQLVVNRVALGMTTSDLSSARSNALNLARNPAPGANTQTGTITQPINIDISIVSRSS